MTPDALIDALALPPETRVDRRVPKTLLLEHGDFKAADRRRIQSGVEELRWVASIKPNAVGIPEYKDERREYLEIAVLTLALRGEANSDRITQLVHRAIPYPVVLAASQGGELALSLAHKRHAQNEAGAVVLDGEPISSPLGSGDQPLLDGFAIGSQPRVHLMALYQGWIELIETLHASRITGRFARAASPEVAEARRQALDHHERLAREVAALRSQAAKESQLNRRVELNLTIRRLEAELAAIFTNL